MMVDVDVLVVGAGPTGLTLAGELLRFGLTVRLIDRAETLPADHSRALGIHARTLEIFEQMGLADRAQDLGIHVEVRQPALIGFSMVHAAASPARRTRRGRCVGVQAGPS